MGFLVMILGFWGYSIAPETSRALKGTQTLPEKLVIATPGNSVGDPSGMVKTWPFQKLFVTSTRGSKKAILNHMV